MRIGLPIKVAIIVVLIGLSVWVFLRQSVKLGLDLQGGVHLVFEAQDTPQIKVTGDTLSRVQAIIDSRINQLGITEPIIQREGDRRLVVELPGYQEDPQAAIDLIGKTALLEFKDTGTRYVEEGTKLTDAPTILTGADLKDARVGYDQFGKPVVEVEFNPEGAKVFAEFTRNNIGRYLAITLDGVVISCPVINSEIPDGKGQIEGNFTLDSATQLAVLLRAGALPVPLNLIEMRRVGPTLGKDTVNASIRSAIIAVILIMGFMLIYYRFSGIIADISLLCYVALLLGLVSALKATLTLPGIAALIMSVGMAVDGNVIIFERIKEELKKGKTLMSSIETGVRRSYAPILDSQITTLIASAVLFYFGTGAVRGFAVMLALGTAISIFTAITVTHILFQLFSQLKIMKSPKTFGI